MLLVLKLVPFSFCIFPALPCEESRFNNAEGHAHRTQLNRTGNANQTSGNCSTRVAIALKSLRCVSVV